MKNRLCFIMLFGMVMLLGFSTAGGALEQRSMAAHLRGPYNLAFYERHNSTYRISAAIHYGHGVQHDVLLLTPFDKAKEVDVENDAEMVDFLYNAPEIEPTMEMYGPYSAQSMFNLYRAIDWTHAHHEQTYDILSDPDIPWEEKSRWTGRSVRYYLDLMGDVARSPAPLEVTMRRAGVMMKPYFGYFRNNYPRSNNFFYVAHWWHPVIYEAMMIAGNDEEQKVAVDQADAAMYSQVLENRPQRMLLSREGMPRYSRMSPATANIFDNLHMLHGIAYDIMAFPDWNLNQKEKELYRVIEAMSNHPGDEKLAGKFTIEHDEMDPRVYYDWMQGVDGPMNRIMREMMEEMMPQMMPENVNAETKDRMWLQFTKKLTPGKQDGEIDGSLADALHKIVPGMKMMPESKKPGVTPQKMIKAMMDGWQRKYGNMPDITPWPMTGEDPELAMLPEEAHETGWEPMIIQDDTPFSK